MMKLYRKLIPIYKFSDNLKESDSLERQALYNNKSQLTIINIVTYEHYNKNAISISIFTNSSNNSY